MSAKPKRQLLLEEAIRLTCGDRNESYGDTVENHEQIAAIFNAVTGHKITPREAAMFQICVKLARCRTSPNKGDNYVDGMAYFGIAFECAMSEGTL
jgi:hypothetical protein